LEAVPPPPGTDPLSLATSRDSCTSDARTAAQPLVSAFRAYLTGYEAKQDPAEVPGLDIVPHTAGADPAVPYYLELRPQFARPAAGVAEGPPGAPRAPSPARAAFRAFAACAYITPLSPDAANAKGIDVSGRPRLLYVPKMGFAIVRPATAPPPGGGNPPA
jgi:hypothetical protein